jgi:transcription termination/antitermination protein NusG
MVAGANPKPGSLHSGNARGIKKMLVADLAGIERFNGADCDLHRFAWRIHLCAGFRFSSYFLVSMRNQWFIVQTLSGQEQKVKESIEKRVKTDEMQDFVKEVLVPMEKVVEVRNQKKTVTSRKLWPGYVFVDMELLDENGRIIEKPWYFIKETQGVIGFVGGEPPVPTPTEEVEQIKNQISQSEETEKPKVNFEVAETIKINNGPFLNFSGVIEEIDPERGKLKVTVNIFGRNTPVELEYWQVEKA